MTIWRQCRRQCDTVEPCRAGFQLPHAEVLQLIMGRNAGDRGYGGSAHRRNGAEHGYGSQSQCAGRLGTKRSHRHGMPTLAFGCEIPKFRVQRQAFICVAGSVEVRT